MKYDPPTALQEATSAHYLYAKEVLEEKEARLVEAYKGFRDLIDTNDYIGAREYLRSMPECASKVLMFREIILAEEKDNDTNRTD